jgi:hypothetical protein
VPTDLAGGYLLTTAIPLPACRGFVSFILPSATLFRSTWQASVRARASGIPQAGDETIICGWLKRQSGNDGGKSLRRDPVRARS